MSNFLDTFMYVCVCITTVRTATFGVYHCVLLLQLAVYTYRYIYYNHVTAVNNQSFLLSNVNCAKLPTSRARVVCVASPRDDKLVCTFEFGCYITR